jgi:uncharacterized protein (DUF1501 family)
MITCHALHSSGAQSSSAEKVTTANDQPDLHPNTDQLAYLKGHTIEDFGIDSKALIAHEFFATQFEQNTLVIVFSTRIWHTTS